MLTAESIYLFLLDFYFCWTFSAIFLFLLIKVHDTHMRTATVAKICKDWSEFIHAGFSFLTVLQTLHFLLKEG